MPKSTQPINPLKNVLTRSPASIAEEMRVFSAQMLQNASRKDLDKIMLINVMCERFSNAYDSLIRSEPKSRKKIEKKLVATCLLCIKSNDWNSAQLLSVLLGYDALKPHSKREPLIDLLLAPYRGPGGNRKLFNYLQESITKNSDTIPSVSVINNIILTNQETLENYEDKLSDLDNGKLDTAGLSDSEAREGIMFTLAKLRENDAEIDNLIKQSRMAMSEKYYPDSELFEALASELGFVTYNTNTEYNLGQDVSEENIDLEEADELIDEPQQAISEEHIDELQQPNPENEHLEQEQIAHEKSKQKQSIEKMKRYFAAYREASVGDFLPTQSDSPQTQTKADLSPVAQRLKKTSTDWKQINAFNQLIHTFKTDLINCFKDKDDMQKLPEKLAKLETSYNAVLTFVEAVKEKNHKLTPQMEYQIGVMKRKMNSVKILFDEHYNVMTDSPKSPPLK